MQKIYKKKCKWLQNRLETSIIVRISGFTMLTVRNGRLSKFDNAECKVTYHKSKNISSMERKKSTEVRVRDRVQTKCWNDPFTRVMQCAVSWPTATFARLHVIPWTTAEWRGLNKIISINKHEKSQGSAAYKIKVQTQLRIFFCCCWLFYFPLWHLLGLCSKRVKSCMLTCVCRCSLMFDDLFLPIWSPELCSGINHHVKTLHATLSSPSTLSAHTLGWSNAADCLGSSSPLPVSLRFSLRSLPRSLPRPLWSDTSFEQKASTSSKYLCKHSSIRIKDKEVGKL